MFDCKGGIGTDLSEVEKRLATVAGENVSHRAKQLEASRATGKMLLKRNGDTREKSCWPPGRVSYSKWDSIQLLPDTFNRPILNCTDLGGLSAKSLEQLEINQTETLTSTNKNHT